MMNNLQAYTDTDRRLNDYSNGYSPYEAMTTSKKSITSEKLEKELEKIKKEKSSLEV